MSNRKQKSEEGKVKVRHDLSKNLLDDCIMENGNINGNVRLSKNDSGFKYLRVLLLIVSKKFDST
jgi:hypothetical protein